ncbi:Werner Syndrome-like exonuclease [Zingiber officinale]|uniref:3'-5' exonuclease domain-containing protein n=1 Tax=Zingiber officinale TaxID=94328 RepID=A0A8J5GR86_ZINOF|nr:Werner Syndrome-like exonuclease [Zingiber officinale]KAG6508425.1 hypothetical protein ZIOFF_033799 [Zingiber officinale]
MSVIVIDQRAPIFTVAINYFTVQTTVTCRAIDVERWIIQILQKHRNHLHGLVVGLDVEWCGDRSIRNRVSVLQICVGFRCLVFQVIHADLFPPNLISFLIDRRFIFVGVAILNDAERIARGLNLLVGNTVDLRALAVHKMRRVDLWHAGLQQLAAEVLRLQVVKPYAVTMSNWENYRLSNEQIAYACADAFLSFEIGKRLLIG